MQDIKDIEAALSEVGDWYWFGDGCENEDIEGIEGLVSAVEVKGGGEGSGEYCHVVLKIEHEGNVRHFKKVGCHVSHDGTYWDGPFTEVQPVQKTIVAWE